MDAPPQSNVLDVLAALSEIEKKTKSHHQYELDENGEQMIYVFPHFTVAVVRAVPEELDERFWRQIWELSGGPFSELKKLMACTDSDAAASIIAELLNQFEPTPEMPSHRAPDLVVIVGPERMRTRFDPLLKGAMFEPTTQFRPLALEEIRPKLSGRLKGSRCVREYLGDTRMIFVEDRPVGSELEAGQVKKLGQAEKLLFRSAEAFRFGFTQTEISHVVRNRKVNNQPLLGHEIREALQSLTRRGLLKYVSGEYFRPDRLGKEFEVRDQSDGFLMEKAGLAKSPYLHLMDGGAISYGQAFSAVHVHEAAYLLAKAQTWLHDEGKFGEHLRRLKEKWERGTDSDNYRLETSYNLQLGKYRSRSRMRQRQFAAGELASWQSLPNMAFMGRGLEQECYMRAKELIAEQLKMRQELHPYQLWLAAYAARAAFSVSGGEGSGIAQDLIEWVLTGEKLCREGIRRGTDTSDLRLWLLGLLVLKSWLLEDPVCGSLLTEAGSTDVSEAAPLLMSVYQEGQQPWVVRPEWFEQIGDEIDDDGMAAEVYGIGARQNPTWRTTRLKWAGAAVLSGNDVRDVIRDTAKNTRRIFSHFSPDFFGNMINIEWESKARFRLEAGVKLFDDTWPHDVHVQALVEICRRRLGELESANHSKVEHREI